MTRTTAATEANVLGATPEATAHGERPRRDHNIWVMPTARILEILGGTFREGTARRPSCAAVAAVAAVAGTGPSVAPAGAGRR